MERKAGIRPTSLKNKAIKVRNPVVYDSITNPKRNAGKHYSKVTKFKGSKCDESS
jgi:hypothetical protein